MTQEQTIPQEVTEKFVDQSVELMLTKAENAQLKAERQTAEPTRATATVEPAAEPTVSERIAQAEADGDWGASLRLKFTRQQQQSGSRDDDKLERPTGGVLHDAIAQFRAQQPEPEDIPVEVSDERDAIAQAEAAGDWLKAGQLKMAQFQKGAADAQ